MEEIENCEDGVNANKEKDKHKKKKSKKKDHKSRKTSKLEDKQELKDEADEADEIWKLCSQNGSAKPWFVISVLGDSSSMVPMTWEKSIFQASLIEMANGAKECWIIHEGGHGKLSQSVVKAVGNHRIITCQHTSTLNTTIKPRSANIKVVSISRAGVLKKENSQNSNDQQFVVSGDYHDVHTEFLKKILQSKVTILRLGKQELDIKIPIIVLLAEGDMDSLRHVDKILKQGTPVVVMKGTGKSADIIIQYLKSGKNILKSNAPLLYGINFNKEDYKSLKSLMESIKKKKHLISVYDVKCPMETLSNAAKNAILLAWDERHIDDAPETDIGTYSDLIASLKDSDYEKVDKNHGDLKEDSKTNNGEYQDEETWLSSSSFPLYFTIAYQHLQSEKEFQSQYFVQLLTKAIEADNIDYVTVLIQEHDVKFDQKSFPDLYKEAVKCKFCKDDCRHLYAVLKTMKFDLDLLRKEEKREGGCIEKKSYLQIIKAARELCRQFLHYPKEKKNEHTKSGGGVKTENEKKNEHTKSGEGVKTENANSENTDDNSCYQDLLIWSLFAHRTGLALLFWKLSEDKLVTALLAAALLKRMAQVAKQVADKSVYEELMEHSRLFEQRSLEMLERLNKEYPSEALDLLTTEFTVWDICISPLRCAYESEFNDFVAHACSQRCLDKIWQNTQIASSGVDQKTCSDWKCRVLRAPRTRFVVHYVIFMVAVVIYSAFLLTNLKTTDKLGAYEIVVYVWLFSDMIEEYLVPIFQRFKHPLRTAGHAYSFCRYISDFWNVLDTVSYIMTFIAIALRFSVYTLAWARRFYSFSLFFMYMRFLHFILIFKKVGVYVILIKEMMKDLGRFLIILIVFMMAVGVMYHVNMYPNHHDMFSQQGMQYWRIWKIMSLPYWQIYGDIFLDDLTGVDNSSCSNNPSDVERCVEYDWITIVITAFYMLLSNLLLVNLVIAMFSARFEKVRSNSETIWSYIRYSYIMEYSVRVPAVVNLIARPIIILYYCRKCRKQRDTVAPIEIEQQKNSPVKKLQYMRTLQSICSVRCT